jgi:hypothetical protein
MHIYAHAHLSIEICEQLMIVLIHLSILFTSRYVEATNQIHEEREQNEKSRLKAMQDPNKAAVKLQIPRKHKLFRFLFLTP